MEFLGMTPEEVREHAQRMRDAQRLLEERRGVLEARVLSSEEIWRGTDAERFRDRWSAEVSPQWQQALARLDAAADTAETEADEQDSASDGGGGGTPGSQGRSEGDDEMVVAKGEPGDGVAGDERLDSEVQTAWHTMEEDEKKKVLQAMYDEEMEKYGLEPVELVFESDLQAAGEWRPDERVIALNDSEQALSNAHMLLTPVHEVRHAAQWDFVDQTEPGRWDWLPFVDSKAEEYESIEEEHGVTREEIEDWRENGRPGEYIGWQEDREAYEAQPVEFDAREQEDVVAKSMTLEDMNRLQRKAGVPETRVN